MERHNKPAYRIYDKNRWRYLTEEEVSATCINSNGKLCMISDPQKPLSANRYVLERRIDALFENDLLLIPDYGADSRHMIEIWPGCMRDAGQMAGFIGTICYREGVMDDNDNHYCDEAEPECQVIGSLMANPELLVGINKKTGGYQWQCPGCSKIIKGDFYTVVARNCQEHVHSCLSLANYLNHADCMVLET